PMTAAEFLNKKIPPISYVLEQYIPKGALTVLVGYMKRGKTTWAYRLAVSVAQGREFLTRETQQGAVLLLAVEEHERDGRARLERFGMTRADHIYIYADKLQSNPKVLEAIEKFIIKHKIVLVTIDSLPRFWNVVNENDNQEVIREVGPLLNIAHKTDAAILP